MNAVDLTAWHGEEAKGVVTPQIRFHCERKAGQIGQRLQVIGMHAGRIEALFIMRHIGVSMGQGPAHPLKLQRFDFIAAGGFNGA